MNIISVFAGRRQNIEILNTYLAKALELKIIDEVHYWNITKNNEDENYLKKISNLRRTSSTGSGHYNLITPKIINNSFELNVKANNDIHIKIEDVNVEYEIVLGGWNNTKSVIRENNKEIFSIVQNGVADGNHYKNIKIAIIDDCLNIFINNELFINQRIIHHFQIKNIFFKTGHRSVGDLKYDTTQNKGFYFMDTCEKNWKNYYMYYSSKNFENDVIIKCDDDIVFIDLYKLPTFIDFIRKNDYDLVSANIINNGVCAYYQQNKYDLIPRNLMDLEYPPICGSLWESGKKAELLHDHFIINHDKFLNYDYKNEIISLNRSRFSINFFGYKGSKWNKIKDCYVDDEHKLTVDYVQNRQFQNVLYTDFYVSHLSFYRQIQTGIDLDNLRNSYKDLYKILDRKKRFTFSS